MQFQLIVFSLSQQLLTNKQTNKQTTQFDRKLVRVWRQCRAMVVGRLKSQVRRTLGCVNMAALILLTEFQPASLWGCLILLHQELDHVVVSKTSKHNQQESFMDFVAIATCMRLLVACIGSRRTATVLMLLEMVLAVVVIMTINSKDGIFVKMCGQVQPSF
jgi:hypothetical protein